MDRYMWRLLRIVCLYASVVLSTCWAQWLMPVRWWLVLALGPTALLDLWLESRKPAGSDN